MKQLTPRQQLLEEINKLPEGTSLINREKHVLLQTAIARIWPLKMPGVLRVSLEEVADIGRSGETSGFIVGTTYMVGDKAVFRNMAPARVEVRNGGTFILESVDYDVPEEALPKRVIRALKGMWRDRKLPPSTASAEEIDELLDLFRTSKPFETSE